MAAVENWRLLSERMETQRIGNRIKGLKAEAKCYRLARDCYAILAKHDKKQKNKKRV